jgi:4-amino-4-deoxy-L-arabinose transferase-like glycosyltransferase
MRSVESRQYSVPKAVMSRPILSLDILVGSAAVAAVVSLGLLVLPRLTFPLQDEVHYVGPTVWLAETGRLVVPDGLSPSLIALVGWGAVFVKLFGGNFLTLRVATLVASALAALTFYALLRHLGFDRVRSALALGVLVLNPLYVSSSVIFITESLFLLLVLSSLYTGLLALQRGQGSLMLAAGLLAGGACLTRQIGGVVVVALAIGLLAAPGLRRSPRLWVMLLGPPALAVTAYLLWAYSPAGARPSSVFADTITWWTQQVRPSHVVRLLNFMLPYMGLFILPLIAIHSPALVHHLARLDRRGKVTLSGGLLLVIIGFLYEWMKGVRYFPYLGNTLDLRGLFWKDFTAAQWGHPWLVAATLAMWGAAGMMVGLTLNTLPLSVRLWWRHPNFPVYVTGVLLAMASISSYFLVDRYFFPWLPFALIAALAVTRSVRLSLPLATGVLALAAVVNVGLMVDYSERAALRWQIARSLVQNGIPANDIGASWEWQWWWGYWQVYHVGDAPPGQEVPHEAPADAASALRAVKRDFDRRRDIDRPYRIASLPEPGYEVEQTYAYWSPLGWTTRHLYVLGRQSTTDRGVEP